MNDTTPPPPAHEGSERPTPRTDLEVIEKILCTEGGDEECTVYPSYEIVTADFARQLERENQALREALEHVAAAWAAENDAHNIEINGYTAERREHVAKTFTKATTAMDRAKASVAKTLNPT